MPLSILEVLGNVFDMFQPCLALAFAERTDQMFSWHFDRTTEVVIKSHTVTSEMHAPYVLHQGIFPKECPRLRWLSPAGVEVVVAEWAACEVSRYDGYTGRTAILAYAKRSSLTHP
jgi:hypothetical protein